jgi:ankyrin repeat protein
MHLLYKVCRADNPQALWNDFKAEPLHEDRSFETVQNEALESMKQFLAETKDINRQHPEKNGATFLWAAADQGHAAAVREILMHPQVDPNKTRLSSRMSPLLIAARQGHEEVVKLLLEHPKIRVNEGSDRGICPLFMATQGGHEEVVKVLVCHQDINVNQATIDSKITALCKAAQLGHEHIVEILISADDIDVGHVMQDGNVAISTAATYGHSKIIGMLIAHPTMTAAISMAESTSMVPFPLRDDFTVDEDYCFAVAKFCKSHVVPEAGKSKSQNTDVLTQLDKLTLTADGSSDDPKNGGDFWLDAKKSDTNTKSSELVHATRL